MLRHRSLSVLDATQLAAARALPVDEQVVLMRELASAAKAIVMSTAFQSAYAAYIGSEYHAVDHGLTVKPLEQLAQQTTTQSGLADFELQIQRQMAAMYVQFAMETPIQDLKMMFDQSLMDWTEEANKPRGSDKAKFAKLVVGAQAIKDLSGSDPDKFRRGYAVLRSAENDGLDTEEALFGAQASSQQDDEQRMWNEHNLNGLVKRVLTQIVAEAPTVDFAAKTVPQNGTTVFVNPAYETRSLAWRRCTARAPAPARPASKSPRPGWVSRSRATPDDT